MGDFGKYVIEVQCANGEKGFYSFIMDGYACITQNLNSASRYFTSGGARGTFEQIRDMEVFTGNDYTYIVDAWICKANTI